MEVVMADHKPTERHEEIQFRQLLDEAVTKPGTIMRAYSLFWNYSLGNQILALIQANNRGIVLGPIASFNRWKELGRYVKKGQKAIQLCMPIICKRTASEEKPDSNETETEITFTKFVFRRNWFMLSQSWHRARGRCRVSQATTNTNSGGGLRAVPEPPASLRDLSHHAEYGIYRNGQYVESVGNLGGNAQRALDSWQRRRSRDALEWQIMPCRVPGCDRGRP
jgi:hypothetical protein